jgi:FMN phosphatase YigB (HAD superfamily)
MTIKFVFDLDLTLYGDNEYEEDGDKVKYESFKKKPFLKQVLNNISHPKYILTNASKDHAEDVLKRMGIDKCFKNIMASDMFELYKPAIQTYKVAINLFKINENDKVFYFEDLAENLKPAKENYNWITIWLNKDAHINKRKPKYVDYKFASVEEAMMYLCATYSELMDEQQKTRKLKINIPSHVDSSKNATDNKSS